MMPRLLFFAISMLLLVMSAGPVGAALLGNNFEISGPGCRFPDVAYGTVSKKYLVVWADYNVTRIFGRFVTDLGAPSGDGFQISEAPSGGLFPAVAFNATDNEFLVTWDDFGRRGDVIHGQRVRASDGMLLGTNFPIGTVSGGIRSAVAWSPENNLYLVVYWGGRPIIDVFGQRVSGSGALLGGNFNVSNDGVFSGYPAVAWGTSGNQFLVSWDNEDGNIYARRVDSATGALLGSTIFVTSGGAKDRSCIAYDSIANRWLVQFNDGANAGFSYDQSGRFINPDGTPSGGLIPLAHTPSFEGDTQFGGDIAFVPIARRFFSSFGTDTGMGGQESFSNGATVGAQVTLGTGYYTSLNNAADPLRNRFLTTWEGMVGPSFRILGQLYATTINPVSEFTAVGQNSQVVLSWRTPNDLHFTGTMIRYRTDGYPTGPEDGAMVVDQLNSSGSNDIFTHTNLSNWTTYYYCAFAHDIGPNYSLVAQAAATPRPEVIVLDSSEFGSGADGWALATWQSGTLAPGTIAHDVATGSIVSTGSGQSNNRDACTREGSMMTRRISTLGRQSIQVEYDVMASLNAPPMGSAAGNCTVLEGSIEDKLAVYYSTAGTNGPWTLAQTLGEGIELPTGWTRELINLAGVTAVNDNTNFSLRFVWQFNSATDTGRIDNVRVLSGAVTAPTPAIGLSTMISERTIQAGQASPIDVVRVNNTGEGVLNFTFSESVPWLFVSPATGSTPGPERSISILYATAGLAVGDYETTIQCTSADAANSPQAIEVILHIIPTACFWEPFGYYDGQLTMMGGANWSGTATNQLQVENGALKIFGGGGNVSATHAVSCAGSNGIIAAEIKIKKGLGSGDFFWNIAIDDPSGNNLARWYGGSTIARGRVGNSITPDMSLSGTTIWDDLYVRIDTAGNTSEFFFNGESYGVISHGTVPGNGVGSIRLERLDRSSAAGDSICFDNLALGGPNSTPAKLNFNRTDPQLVLSWPATGTGFQLQSTPDLNPPIGWSPIAGPFGLTNGFRIFTTNIAANSAFYRLQAR
jgi:hypothetical protein